MVLLMITLSLVLHNVMVLIYVVSFFKKCLETTKNTLKVFIMVPNVGVSSPKIRVWCLQNVGVDKLGSLCCSISPFIW
jgi:hypothetical protein